ncbi:ArsR/SmtB family transcription factor [Kineococcus sp. GCM10028916]|jgi:DNA-binding transcriptional ArsR family regulator|uniref:ArsR/SmtB family transcription factor n=1 Tax=Kineococcus sp. GCM10028916 TaxID=3273394 RepID=UPI00364118A0
MSDKPLPTRDEIEIGPVLSALSDPNRRQVVRDLFEEPEGTERTCTSFNLPVTKATSTHHFRVLREAGLTYDLSYGNRRGVSLRRADIEARFPGLLAAVFAGVSTGEAPPS